jgi:hypothetical protein
MPLPLEDLHHDHYCSSLAGHEACRKLGLDHTLVEIELWDKVCDLKTAMLPGVKKHFAESFSNIRGHDVLIVGFK